MVDKTHSIGRSEVRKDAWDKVKGFAEYVADIPMDGYVHGVVLRSPHHFAKIKNINTDRADIVPGVQRVLTAKDIPGAKTFGALVPDQPSLAIDCVRHIGEPVALIIADTRANAIKAAEQVEVDYDLLEPVFVLVQLCFHCYRLPSGYKYIRHFVIGYPVDHFHPRSKRILQ